MVAVAAFEPPSFSSRMAWPLNRLAPNWLLAMVLWVMVAAMPCSQMPPPPPPTLVLPLPPNWTVLSGTRVWVMLPVLAALLLMRVGYRRPPPGEPALMVPLPPITLLLMTWTWFRLRFEFSVSMPPPPARLPRVSGFRP